MAVLLPPYLYEQTTINAIVNQEIFTVSGKIETQIGWKEVYGHEEDSEDQTLPPLKQNQFYQSLNNQNNWSNNPTRLF